MIITKMVSIKISWNNVNYWRNRGYQFEYKHPRWNKNSVTKIDVLVTDLASGSNVRVDCMCNDCGKIYSLAYQDAITSDECESCIKRKLFLGNTLGTKNKGKSIPMMQGSNHPNYNPNKSEYQAYSRKVHWLTTKQDLSILENFDKPRGLAGVEGAYQLDHIFSIKDGFDFGIPVEMIANIKNLQIIPWEENNKKRENSEITLKEFLQKFL